MTGHFGKPQRKNPLARTRQPLLPPAARSRRAHELTAAAAEGRFALQRCGHCGAFAYPVREACPNCLSADLILADAPDTGFVLSMTAAEVPADNYFRERAPWRVGLVQFDCGPTALCHLHAACTTGIPVQLFLKLDKAGQAVFFAAPREGKFDMADDPQWRELTADPRHRRVLITDGRHPVTGSLVARLREAGAGDIFVGVPEGWKPFAGREALERHESVNLLPLDVTNETSVADFARDYGAKIEIVINTADFVRPGGILAPGQINPTRDAMEVIVFGMMRLAQSLAPVMIARGADGAAGAAAWVNLLSIYAEAHSPSFAAYGAAQAAALALSHALRAELGAGGVRLINVLSGPTESEWFQPLQQPKVAHKAIADAVVDGLRRGLEDIYVGDVARDLHQRLKTNPKAVERELGRERP
jgi:short-subunit dehydrogenase/uncharacterized OB-fold protein